MHPKDLKATKTEKMELTDIQLAILEADGHLLVTGGPGSGKTTVSTLKAVLIAEQGLGPGQDVLFLSFARATIARIAEAIETEHRIPSEHKRRIRVETYHSFFWRVLKTHGYLVGLPRKLRILAPPEEAVALSAIRRSFGAASKLSDSEKAKKIAAEEAERMRLAKAEGRVAFDVFAHFVTNVVQGSSRIRELLGTMYPTIILDEFQDTNSGQWHVVQSLGEFSTLIALADPEQRIYDFIGADPERPKHFRASFSPREFDLGLKQARGGMALQRKAMSVRPAP